MKKKQNHDKWYYDEEKVAKVAIGVCLLCIFIFVDYSCTVFKFTLFNLMMVYENKLINI